MTQTAPNFSRSRLWIFFLRFLILALSPRFLLYFFLLHGFLHILYNTLHNWVWKFGWRDDILCKMEQDWSLPRCVFVLLDSYFLNEGDGVNVNSKPTLRFNFHPLNLHKWRKRSMNNLSNVTLLNPTTRHKMECSRLLLTGYVFHRWITINFTCLLVQIQDATKLEGGNFNNWIFLWCKGLWLGPLIKILLIDKVSWCKYYSLFV